MLTTLITNKYNHNIRCVDMSWNDFVEININAPVMTSKGNGAIIGGECVWTPKPFNSKFGGYIPAAVNRKCSNRWLIILDSDTPDENLLSKCQDYFAKHNIAWGYYTTFSATKDKPRYRVCTYLDEPVSPEEYKLIAQSIMHDLGERNFDPVSRVANQIMFLGVRPQVSDDSDEEIFYESKFFDGQPISAGKILEYINIHWADRYCFFKAESKPKSHSKKPKDKITTSESKHSSKDPRTKDSIVGTFTTLYSIDDVMSLFLSGVYQKVGERYKPIDSNSPPGGRIVDNGLYYLTSHSNKDKAYGSLKNSFDLVKCNLINILTDEGSEKLKQKARAKGIMFPDEAQIMFEWAMSIPAVRDAEIKRKKGKKQ